VMVGGCSRLKNRSEVFGVRGCHTLSNS